MTKSDNKQLRVHKSFEEWIRRIAAKRVLEGRDNEMRSPKRMTLAILRCPEINVITERLLKSDMNKKGQGQLFGGFFGLIIFIVMAFIVLLFFAAFQYGFGTLTNAMLSVPENNLNFTMHAQNTFGNVNAAISQFTWWSYLIIFGMIIGFFFGFYLVTKVHPGFAILWLILVAVAVVFSIGISNAYEQVYTSNGILHNTLTNQYSISSWLIINLPVIVAAIGLLGGIFMFIGINRAVEDVSGF